MKNKMLIVCLLLVFYPIFPTGKSPKLKKTFQNDSLGIQFQYRSEDFDDEKDGLPPVEQWKGQRVARLGIALQLPPNYSARIMKIERDWYIPSCTSNPISDSALIIGFSANKSTQFTESIKIYYTSGDFQHIAYNENFALRDSNNDVVEIKGEHPSKIQAALALNNWASLGRQDLAEKASYLNGKIWKGVRGHNFIGVNNDQGYAGLDYFYASFLLTKMKGGCTIVCSYKNMPYARNPLKEYRFYEIVSSIKFVN